MMLTYFLVGFILALVLDNWFGITDYIVEATEDAVEWYRKW